MHCREVAGEVALVTGAGHGVGREIAIQLASLGCKVACVDKDESMNACTVAMIKEDGGQAWGFVCDVSYKEEVFKMAAKVREEVGEVTILVNNAGVMVIKQFLEQSDAEVEDTVNVNLLGQLWLIRQFLPGMLRANKSSIVFMCGLPGYGGAPYMVPYSASKFAVRGLREALYVELRQTHPENQVHLMLVSPYCVDTGKGNKSRMKLPGLLPDLSVTFVASEIITAMRRGDNILFLPAVIFYISKLVRLLPAKVQLLITDLMDTGIEGEHPISYVEQKQMENKTNKQTSNQQR